MSFTPNTLAPPCGASEASVLPCWTCCCCCCWWSRRAESVGTTDVCARAFWSSESGDGQGYAAGSDEMQIWIKQCLAFANCRSYQSMVDVMSRAHTEIN